MKRLANAVPIVGEDPMDVDACPSVDPGVGGVGSSSMTGQPVNRVRRIALRLGTPSSGRSVFIITDHVDIGRLGLVSLPPRIKEVVEGRDFFGVFLSEMADCAVD